MTAALIEGEKMRQALEMARAVQMSTLPTAMPAVPSYDVGAMFEPAELTGGDTYDVALVDGRLLVVLGDATGHGIAPALSVTQMHAMLRIAFRLGADLETAFVQVNDRLAETLADDRFITAFIGLIDPATHELTFHSGGQGPVFVYRAATGTFERYKPTSFPLGAMRLTALRPATRVQLLPGDILIVVSDGVYEYENAGGEQFGEARVQHLVADGCVGSMADIVASLMNGVRAFASAAKQEDDMTAVFVKRLPENRRTAEFKRDFAAIAALVDFSARSFAELGIDAGLAPTVDLAVEELFTNMVKYGAGSTAPVKVTLAAIAGGVEVTLVDRDVEPFDITRSPDVDIDAPIEQRKPGGLGLHLIRKLAESVTYTYAKERRESRISLRFTGSRRTSGTR
jgi:anti-sigma regulatory factor (Ser/Thr protein kinase)